MAHIQKMAPGPPLRMAVATPTMLPVPMVAASAVHRLWNWLMALSFFSVWAVMSRSVKMAPMVFRSQYRKCPNWKKTGAHRHHKSGAEQQRQPHRPPDDAVDNSIHARNGL